MHWQDIPDEALAVFRAGAVIPAHPLALDADRRLDERRQRALTRYYVDAGAGGLAVGVHTTQFAIREVGLYGPCSNWRSRRRAPGRTGRSSSSPASPGPPTRPSPRRGSRARSAITRFCSASRRCATPSEDALIAHCRRGRRRDAGGRLLPAAGGRRHRCSRALLARFAAIDNVIGIKVAPFNRYRTLDVVHGVAEAGAQERISLYTGNDDHIVLDLTVPFRTEAGELRFVGGLLGHWSVWTRTAVEILERCRAVRGLDDVPAELLALDSAVTDCNAAFFDVANGFHGVIAGCHEVLRRQGLLDGRWCLDPEEDLSPGQAEEIDRVCRVYPELADDDFVAENLERWLGGS